MVGFIESHMKARGRPAATARGGGTQEQSCTCGASHSLYIYVLNKLIIISSKEFIMIPLCTF